MKETDHGGTRLTADAAVSVSASDQLSHAAEATVVAGPWGYACIEADAVLIQAVMATPEYPLRRVLAELFKATGQTRMVFTAILDPEDLRPRLRNIVREWDEYVDYLGDYSHCIEIHYEPKVGSGNQVSMEHADPTRRSEAK